MFDKKKLRFLKKNFMYHDYIESMGLSTKPTNSYDEIRINCPKCEESDFKCYVNDEKKTFCCFKCDFGHYGNGDVFDFVSHVEGIPVSVAISRLMADYRSVTPEDIMFEDEEDSQISPPSFENIKTIEDLPQGTYAIDEADPDSQPYIDYLLGRGFTMEDILSTNAHYTSSLARVKRANGKRINIGSRVLWPIYGGKGNLVSWLTRAISSDPEKAHIKYINCPDTELSKTVWPFVPMAPCKTDAIIVEGLIDALSLRRAGFAAYCVFGKKLSEEQILLLKHWGVTDLTFFFDYDAKKTTISLIDNVRLRFKNVYVVDLSKWNAEFEEKADAGYMLSLDNGDKLISEVMHNRISVADELSYIRWKIS